MNLLFLAAATAALNAIPVEVAVQVGFTQQQSMRDVAFLPSGRHVITAGSGVSLWEVQSGRQLRAFKGHTADVAALSISRDGRWLATGGFDRTLRIFEIETGKLAVAQSLDASVVDLEFSPQGTSLAVVTYGPDGNYASSFRLFPWQDGKLGTDRRVPSIYSIEGVSFSADGRRIMTLSAYRAQAYDLASGKPIGAEVSQRGGAFHPKRPELYLHLSDGKLVVRNFETGQILHEVPSSWSSSDRPSISFSTDGSRVLVGADVFETSTFTLVRTLDASECGALNHDGRIAAAFQTYVGGLYQVDSGKQLRAFDSSVVDARSVSLSSDGRSLVTAGLPRLWDLARGRPQRSFGTAPASEALLIESAQLTAVLGEDGIARLYELDSDRVRPLPLKNVRHLATDGSGKWLAALTDGQAALVSLPAGKVLKQWRLPGGASSLALSPGGTTLVTGHSDGLTRVWSADGRQLGSVNPKASSTDEVRAVAVSHDGKLFATGHDDGHVRLWRLPSLELVKTLESESKGSFIWVTCLAFSQDDTTLAAGSEDNQVRWWDVGTGQRRSTLVGHNYAVSSVAFQSPQRLVSASTDRTVRVWDAGSGEVVATLVSMPKDGYAIFTPDNYYTISRGASDSVSFLRGLDVYPFDSFDLVFNRPDVIIERLRVAPRQLVDAFKAAYATRVRRMGFSLENLSADMHLPEAHFVGSRPPIEVQARQLSLTIAASDSQYLLDRINLYVNGVAVFGQAGQSVAALKTKQLEKTLQLELSRGPNFIEVSVHNEKGIESAREQLEVRYTGPAAAASTWLVSFGVSKYADHNYDLNYAAKDANDVSRALSNGRRDVKTQVFVDAGVTRESLAEARKLLERSGVDDTVVVFAAGHGLLTDDFRYYFASADTDFEDPAARAIPYDQLEGLLDGLKARRKLLLIDTCNSGEVDPEALKPIKVAEGSIVPHGSRGLKAKYKLSLSEVQGLLTELFADLRRGTGAVVISSAGGAEYALESAAWKNGVFTFALLEALQLRGADANKDRKLAVSELRDHVAKRVPELTKGAQKPTVRRDNLFVDFPVSGEGAGR
jgi:WD40 repeat protein